MILLVLCLQFGQYIDAAECNSERCPSGSIGNGVCDPGCMSSACNYDSPIYDLNIEAIMRESDCVAKCLEACSMELLLNSKCDTMCSIPECMYDLGRCGDCEHGCFDGLLGNGVCDSACNNEKCEYDREDCGRCDNGCYEPMLGNGNCDDKCYNSRCNWDFNDCYSKMCAPGCNPGMIGNSICNPECKVLACDYDKTDCFCDIKRACSYELRTSATCQAECNLKECDWHDGKCGDCNSGCFFNMIDNGQCEPQCNVEECKFDFPDCEDTSNPELEVMYVTNVPAESDGSGTKDDPYTSLYLAMAQVSYKFTVIYLLGGEHYLKLKQSTSTLIKDVYDPLARKNDIMYGGIYISTAFCYKYPDLKGCAQERATVYLEDKIRITASAQNVVITKINFRGDHLVCNLNECGDCSLRTCKYCPYVTFIDDEKILTDRLEIITFQEYTKYSLNCAEDFSGYSLIEATNIESLILKDLNFTNFQTWQDSLISFSGSELNLVSVDFDKIHPGNKQKDAIVKFLSSGSGVKNTSFRYANGSVKYLYDGYEINPAIDQGGFLYIEAYGIEIEIIDITFSYNLLQNTNTKPYFKPLIYITGKGFNILLEDLNFMNNFSSEGLIDINLEASPVSTSSFTPSKVLLNNLLFYGNSANYGLINFISKSYIIDFRISKVRFDRCVSTTSAMMNFTNTGDDTSGMTKPEFYRVHMYDMVLRFDGLKISSCYTAEYILYTENFFNLEINDFNITYSGDSSRLKIDVVNQFTFNDFINLKFLSLQKTNRVAYTMKSLRLVLFLEIYKASITKGFYASNNWSGFTLIYLYSSYPIFIDSLNFINLKRESSEIGLLKILYATGGDITISNCSFTDIQNMSGSSSIYIFDIRKLTISNIKMNRSRSKGANLYIRKFKEVKIESCVFEDIFSFPVYLLEGDKAVINNSVFTKLENTFNACGVSANSVIDLFLYNSTFSHGISDSSSVLFTNSIQNIHVDSCTFTNVTSVEGIAAGIRVGLFRYYDADPALIITNSIFTGCKAEKNVACIFIAIVSKLRFVNLTLTSLKFVDCKAQSGSAIYIDSSIIIKSSILESIYVEANYNSIAGPIHTQHSDGILNIKNSKFTRNSGTVAAISGLLTTAAELVRMNNIEIIDNDCTVGGIDFRGMNGLVHIYSSNLRIINNKCAGLGIGFLYLTDSDSLYDGNLLGVQVKEYGKVELTNARIVNNKNPAKGGGAYIQSYSKFECTDCKIIGNSADTGGGIMVDQEGSVTLTRTIFSKNTAFMSGAAMYIIECYYAISYLEDCEISENISILDGSIHIIVANIEIKNSIISKNISQDTTPGIVLNYSKLKLTDSTIEYQNAFIGSFLYIQTNSTAEVQNCTFSNGSARKFGGAIAILTSTVSFVNCKFRDLHSEENAAVFFVPGQSHVTIENCSFSNLTSNLAGSIFSGIDSSLKISNSTFTKFKEVGILGTNMNLLKIEGSIFDEGIGQLGGVISCIQCKEILLINSQFNRNYGVQTGGVIYLLSNIDSRYTIQSSHFIDNRSAYGGVIFIDGGSLNITDSHFINNLASFQGGVANSRCSGTQACNLQIEDSTFTKNIANVAGGAIFWVNTKPKTDYNVTFSSNSAKYGDSIASYPIKIQFVENSTLVSYLDTSASIPLAYKLDDKAPGQKLKDPLYIALVDHYDQIVNSDSSSFAEIEENTSGVIVSGTTKVVAKEGVYIFDNIQIYASPGTQVYLEITTSAIYSTKKQKDEDEDVYVSSISLEVNLRDCVLGEARWSNECKLCDKGTYCLVPEDNCQECPIQAECLGNYTMFPRKHYWRSDLYSDVFYKCPNVDACIGSSDYESFEGECEEGYRGTMCQACDNGYARGGENMCKKCLSGVTSKLILIFVSMAILVYCFIMVRTTFIASYVPSSLQSMYIKIFTNYLQLIGISIGLDIPWPGSLMEFFNLHKNSGNATSQAFSFDCFLETSDSNSYVQVYYKKITIVAFMPLIALLICIIIWSIIALHKKNKKYLKLELVATIVILFFFIHPKITEIFLSIYSCREIEDRNYLNVNLDIECWKGDHIYYALLVALPSVIVWTIGVPTAILMYMMRNRVHLNHIEMKLKLGFLYNGYRLRTYYWEFIILYRNVIVIMIMVFLSTLEINTQALAALLVLLLSYYYHISVNPYRHPNLNELEKRGIFAATITIYLGLYYLTDDLQEDSKIGLFVLVLCTNLYFLVLWASYFGYAWFQELIKRVKILKKIFNRQDGFQTDILIESHLTKKVYLEEDQKIMTFVNPEYPEHQIALVDIPNNMLALYKQMFRTENTVEDYHNLSNEMYFKDNWINSARSFYSGDMDSYTQTENEAIYFNRV